MAVASFELLRFAQSLCHTKYVFQNFIGDQILKICLSEFDTLSNTEIYLQNSGVYEILSQV